MIIPDTLLVQLRRYWQQHQPRRWLFPNSNTPSLPLSVGSIQKRFSRAKAATGITKKGGIHSLRHAYATHQLEQGLPVHQLQQQLGHAQLQTTLRYVHWVSCYRQTPGGFNDLIGQLEIGHD